MKTSSKYSLMWLMQIGIAIIISYSVVSYIKNAIVESQRSVTHTRNVISKLSKVNEMLLNAETGQRGYLITGKDKYLDPYNIALDRIGQDLYDLKVLISDDPEQYIRYLELEKTTHEKLQELRNTLYLKETNPPEATKRVSNDTGFFIMNRFRSIMSDIVSYEEKKLEKHQNDELTNLKIMTLVIPLLIVGDFVLLILAYYLIREQETTEIKKFIANTIDNKNSKNNGVSIL